MGIFSALIPLTIHYLSPEPVFKSNDQFIDYWVSFISMILLYTANVLLVGTTSLFLFYKRNTSRILLTLLQNKRRYKAIHICKEYP
jgi:hypothetical protein